MPRRIAVGMISHETNTFSPIPTTPESFSEERIGILDGQDVIRRMTGTKTGIGGFIDVAGGQDWELVGTVAAGATPSANVEADAYDDLKGRMLARLRSEGPFDGVLLHLHGAMLAKNAPDAEGDLCRSVREVVGPDVSVIVELDLHGNITADFCSAVDGVFAYNTNPHVDAYERGAEAAGCLAKVLNGEIARPKVFISKPPMLPPTINMRTAEGPMRRILDRGLEWEARPEIIDVSVFGGFPYADFDQAGTSIVVTATDHSVGDECARDVGRFAWQIRDEFLKEIPDVPRAVSQTMRIIDSGVSQPVVLADVADNPGGGGSGDTTHLLQELVDRGCAGAVACVWDPATVQQAFNVREGYTGHFSIGGKAAPGLYGDPVEVTGRVARLSDGQFVGTGPVVRGQTVDCGPSARIDVGDLKIVVTTIRHAANDRGYFRVVGVEPEREPLLMIKSRGHFRADFEPICHSIIEVDAPGAANPNLARYDFQNVRRPIWPLDPDTQWNE
jgi:microcystin degradation protein MlrC